MLRAPTAVVGQDRREGDPDRPPSLRGEQRSGVQMLANHSAPQVVAALAALGGVAVADRIVTASSAAGDAVEAASELLDLVAALLEEPYAALFAGEPFGAGIVRRVRYSHGRQPPC